MDPKILNEESNHLNEVVNKVKDAKESLNRAMEAMGAQNLDRLKELREDPETGADFLIFLEQLHEKNLAFNFKDKYQRLEEFEYLLREPYFSRIDLFDHSDLTTKQIYIGKFGYTEEQPVVTDWRTKVASVYYRYRYPQKNVSYDTPDGKETKDLTLKRTFEIENGEMIKYFNNDIQFDESEIIVSKIEQRTGGVLEDIIETIQESQLDIIESDPRQICIVQGCVGSGKSTVAIHKLSHIFFNYSNYIRPERSILIAKNQILVGYLSTLFPKLGIFDINYKTLRDLIVNVIFREEIGLNYDLDKDEDTSLINIDVIRKIRKAVDKVHRETESNLEELFSNSENESFGGYKYSLDITPTDNVIDIISDLEEELSMQKDKLKDNPKSVKSWIYKENIKTIRKILNKLHKIKYDIKEKTLPKISKTFGIKIKEEVGYKDVVLYLYLYSELVGIRKFTQYDYAVIDEGQDFSLIEYAVLSKYIMRGRISIMGDLNQSIEKDGVGNWDMIKEVVKEAKKANVFTLNTNYRSTKQIIDYSNKILTKYTDKYLPESIERYGSKPEEKSFINPNEMINQLIREVGDEYSNLNKSIGIICFNEEIKETIINQLNSTLGEKDNIIALDKSKSIHYIPKGVYIMSDDDCKGLEFSKVYVIGKSPEQVNDFKEARKLFVSVTRAMNELNVFYEKTD